MATDNILLLYQHYTQCKGIVTDSRNAIAGQIFFALRGPNFDGNEFAASALSKGTVLAVIDNAQYKQDDRYVLVDDVMTTLQTLANYHRRQLKIPIIGITGSSGKTTTKELMYEVLRCRYRVVATQGNLNNHIGVPLTLLSIDHYDEIAIIEMGASHVGEIAALCEIAMPTHGLITNIGHMHIEGFGSFEGVIQGKRELYTYLLHRGGTVFVNSTDNLLCRLTEQFSAPIYYPQVQDFCHCTYVTENPGVVCKDENGRTITSNLLGKFHFYNIATALCIAKYFHVNAEQAAQAIQNYRPNNNRSQLIKKGSNTIFLDAYNANLATMKGAIEALHHIKSTYKVLILGDMAELGQECAEAHSELVRFTNQGHYKAVLLCGTNLIAAQKHNPAAHYFEDKASLAHYLSQQKFTDTAFIIKGCWSLQLATLVDYIHDE